MIEHAEYERRVRDQAAEILTREYQAFERSALDPHAQRFAGMRPFWAGITFESITTEGEYPNTELVIRFRDDHHPENRHGFREGIWKVVQWWEDYGPPADMRNDPERLAHEMIFIMVYSIADADGAAFERETGEDVNWFTGGEAWTAVVTPDGTRIPLLR